MNSRWIPSRKTKRLIKEIYEKKRSRKGASFHYNFKCLMINLWSHYFYSVKVISEGFMVPVLCLMEHHELILIMYLKPLIKSNLILYKFFFCSFSPSFYNISFLFHCHLLCPLPWLFIPSFKFFKQILSNFFLIYYLYVNV